jgi:phosphate acetyltransferase
MLEERFDYLLIEGTSLSGEGSLIEFDVNLLIAKKWVFQRSFPASGVGKSLEELAFTLL